MRPDGGPATFPAAGFYAMLCAALLPVARCMMNPYRLLAMTSTLLFLAPVAPVSGASGAAAAAGAARAAGATGSGGPAGTPPASRRIDIPSPEGKPYPYSLEIPAGWQVQSSKNVPGVFLGPPAAGDPETDTHLVYIRTSPVTVLDPESVVASIKQKSAADGWSAPVLEVREVGGVRGVLVRMDSGTGDQARSTLVLKMPLGKNSLDFMFSGPRAEFERQLPSYQRVILSVLPKK
jgi:hypothetical protein